MIGWECPVCGEANSPFSLTCAGGPHKKYTLQDSGNVAPAQCTCGTTVKCPLHGYGSYSYSYSYTAALT